MSIWKLIKVELVYPTGLSGKSNTQCFAISGLNFSYKNYQLQFGYDDSRSFGLVDFTNQKKPNIVYEGTIDEISKSLEKFNLPEFNFNPNNYDGPINYFITENDDDGNHDAKTNINLVKSGDYGYPIDYNSKYSVDYYEYSSNEKEKQEIESVILDCIQKNSLQLFY